jgi:hypothetical protein
MSQLNFALLAQISQQAAVTGDPALAELLREISAYPVSDEAKALESGIQTNLGGVFVPLMLATKVGLLSFISTTTLFGTPRDITLSEIALEAFFPADSETAAIMQRLHA